MDNHRIDVRQVSVLSKATFPVAVNEYIDLFNAMPDLKNGFDVSSCCYDERFKRIILRTEVPQNLSITFFCNGKIMVYGIIDRFELEAILEHLWTDFFARFVKKK